MPSNLCERQVFFLMCVLVKSCQAFTNDAKEMLDLRMDAPFQSTTGNTSLNRARSGGRRFSSMGTSEQGPVGCRELRSMKYVSGGQCTSLTPVKELVCAGGCLPLHKLPNRIGTAVGNKLWSRYQDQEWRCVTDRTRNQRVRLRCHDGSDRTYRITVVTSCKCKKYSRQHNESGTEPKPRPGGGRGKGRPDKTGVRQNPKTDT